MAAPLAARSRVPVDAMNDVAGGNGDRPEWHYMYAG
jgi:hypothetical protein